MEKSYLDGFLLTKKQPTEKISFNIAKGPWKLPGGTMTFMASIEGLWTGLDAQETMFFGLFINAIDREIDFPTKLSIQLYATQGKKTARVNACMLAWVEQKQIHIGLLVDDEIVAESTLDQQQSLNFREMVIDMEALVNGARHEH